MMLALAIGHHGCPAGEKDSVRMVHGARGAPLLSSLLVRTNDRAGGFLLEDDGIALLT